MEAMFLKESMSIRWVAETGLVDAIDRVIKEFKETRGLLVRLHNILMIVFLMATDKLP